MADARVDADVGPSGDTGTARLRLAPTVAPDHDSSNQRARRKDPFRAAYLRFPLSTLCGHVPNRGGDGAMTDQGPGEIIGSTVFSGSGDKIGTVSQLYGGTGQVTWVAVTEGHPRSRRLVPLSGAVQRGKDLVVPFTQEVVAGSPIVPAGDLGVANWILTRLHKHYGLEPDETEGARSATGGPLHGPPAGGGDRPAPREKPASTPRRLRRPRRGSGRA
jgi:hypothetical protein